MNVRTHVCKSQLSSRRKLTVVSSSERADGSFSLALLDDGEELVPRDGDLQGLLLVLRVITCYNN